MTNLIDGYRIKSTQETDYSTLRAIAVDVEVYSQRLNSDPNHFLGIPHATVRIGDIEEFYETNNCKVSGIIFRDVHGNQFYSFGKDWSKWNPEREVRELCRIGSGAYGDNPVWRRVAA